MPVYNRALAEEVTLYSYNPYEYRYPNRKLISRYAVDLVKRLRAEGIEVVIEPRSQPKLEYYFRKGISELLRDPLVIYLASIPIGVVSGVVTSWLADRLKRGTAVKQTHDSGHVVLELEEAGKTLRYTEAGRRISDRRFALLLKAMDDERLAYQEALQTQPPYAELGYPVFLEHRPTIVGWADIKETDKGMLASPAEITDEETLSRFQSGDLDGFSIAGIAKRSRCSVCGRDYLDCNHIAGLEYNGVECTNGILECDLCDVSIVRDPMNPRCRRIDDDDEDQEA